jgi:hypothetical protein
VIYTKRNALSGAVTYAAGDCIASIITHEFSVMRLMGIALIGGTLYALEVPNYFNWISKFTSNQSGWKLSTFKASLALLYFNPLWIARHLLFIKLVSGHFDQINFDLLKIGLMSFLVNIPISFLANFIIQNKISLNRRFVASAIFSGLMAIFYALSGRWFS